MQLESNRPEKVRLVIWDLDDTFWAGTLTEGGISLIPKNVELVKQLSERGIVNSICSKNDLDRARDELKRAGMWDYFVFPQIDWVPKGAMVRTLVEWSQLRCETVMFIDDNPMNLNEVAHANPGIQVAGPDILADMLDNPLFKGKNDSSLTRLKQYKVLEAKQSDRAHFADSNRDFLRQSKVRISFHQDIMPEFDRIHELINRTNQLNFTKKRLPECKVEARAVLEKELYDKPSTQTAYVKVSDRYGDYGIVGFYMTRLGTRGRVVEHFLFSCRTLNMGIEQFVFRKLGMAKLEIVGEVISELRSGEKIDWITVVDDAEKADVPSLASPMRLCVRGACELDQMVHYLGHTCALQREFAFPYRGWGIAVPAAQNFSLWPELKKPANRELFDRLPALHPKMLDSCIISGKADVFVLSFSLETQWTHYQYKPTGVVVPLKLEGNAGFSPNDLTKLSFFDMRNETKLDLSEIDWSWFCRNFEFVGGFDPDNSLVTFGIYVPIYGKRTSIFVLLNTRHGKPSALHNFNSTVNATIEAETRQLPATYIRLDDLIHDPSEVIDAHHFRRTVYLRLADAIKTIVNRRAEYDVVRRQLPFETSNSIQAHRNEMPEELGDHI